MIEELKNKLNLIETNYTSKIQACKNVKDLQDLQVAAIGRKGELTELLKSLKDLSLEEKKIFGPLSNALKIKLSSLFEAKNASVFLF